MAPGILLASFALALAATDDAPSFSEDVRPILAEHCFACHGPDPAARSADLRLDTETGLRGTDGQPGAVVPGDLAESELFYRVTTDDEFDRMPPLDAGEGLSAEEVDVLRRWIEAGADWESHWAYRPFREVEPPSTHAHPVDAFLSARWPDQGLEPAPEATPERLIRRLHLDLTGLPPAEDVVAAYVADPSRERYAAIVDELLASAAYGEHQARHWLDAARYADSHGFTIDGGRTIWPWRDWVVDSIRRDQPFDEFTVEQLAGDLLPDATRDQRIATGFHRNTQINQEGGAGDEENRVSAVLDRVATTGAVWLGSSVACAQCHTHKFDPITQTEYYGLYAFFNSTADSGVSTGPTVLVPKNADEAQAARAWESKARELRTALDRSRDAAGAGWTPWQPERATGSNGPELRPEEDGSYRVVGQSPVYSTYVLQGSAPLGRVGAVRLEVLPDGGPGRARNRNFVLQAVRVATREPGREEWTSVPLASARASHEQGITPVPGEEERTPYPIASTIDPELGGGWAILPLSDEPHVAEFVLADPTEIAGRELRVELVQEHGSNHTIGAFRMLLRPDADGSGELVTPAWREAWGAVRQHRSARPRMASTLVLEERAAPRTTRRFERGSFLDPREEVAPGFPRALDHFSGTRAADGAALTRLDLARWLVDPENALVHRVTVNRWWQHLFGRGLVSTENDFGLRGARPTHPDLLEWLARDYVASGFSRRHVLRTLVTSTAYRRSVKARDADHAADPSNLWLARQSRLRLSGEQLRDSMLAVAGVLDGRVGGPPVQPPQPDGVFAFTQSRKKWEPSDGAQRFRRSLYTRIWRSSPFPFYGTFDAPAPNVTCTRRVRSSTPLQALALANDPMVMELAAAFGERIAAELPGADDAERVAAAFRLALGRDATAAEAERLEAHVEWVRAHRGEDAAWTALARVLFNLDEFSHRP